MNMFNCQNLVQAGGAPRPCGGHKVSVCVQEDYILLRRIHTIHLLIIIIIYFSTNRYVPYVGDSKRAMDEYTSEIFLGGKVN